MMLKIASSTLLTIPLVVIIFFFDSSISINLVLSLEIIKLFEDFNAVGVSVLIATHDLGLIARMKYRTLTLKQGNMINDGVVEGLYSGGENG